MICASIDPIRIGYTGLQPSQAASNLCLLKVEDQYIIKHLPNSQMKHSGLVGRAEERITPERRQ